MTSVSKEDKHASSEGSGSKTGKLARRARSFKEDFLDIISQMRSPGGSSNAGGGSSGGSPRPPRSPKARTSSSSDSHPDDKNPISDLQIHVRQVQFALKHFRDVVSKNKLEVLAGNGTIVLESIATIHGVLNSYVFIDQSSSLVSATKQVYQSLATLIKLCDDVLLGGEKAINKQNVHLLLEQVEDAVQNLVDLASIKMSEKGCSSVSGTPGSSVWNAHPAGLNLTSGRDSQGGGRSSLPDIPLTPRERLILEQTSAHSQTHEYISPEQPPPKPPLPPMRVWVGESPPPLPPKKKGGSTCGTMERMSVANERLLSNERIMSSGERLSLSGERQSGGERLSLGSERHSGSERLSIRSDESSLGSSDSMLNASSNLDTDELKASNDDFVANPIPGVNSLVNGNQTGWDSSCSNVSERTQSPEPLPPTSTGVTGEWTSLSSSGFTSMRSSSRSYSYSSSSKSSSVSVCVEQQQTNRSSVQQTSVQQSLSSSSVQQSVSATSVQQSVSSTSVQQSSSIQQITSSSMATSSSALLEEMRNSLTADSSVHKSADIHNMTDRPPALPAKKRSIREREPSTYDNVPVTQLSCSPPSSHPPPLPMKKKHIMAYMEMFGNCSHSNTSEFLRHSVHSYSMMQAEWQQHQASISSAQSCSFTHHQTNSVSREEIRMPPALPPKRSRPHIAAPPTTPPGSPVNHLDMTKLDLEGPVSCPPVANGSISTPMKNGGSIVPLTGVISPLSSGVSPLSSIISPLGSSISPSGGSGVSPIGSAVSPIGSNVSPLGTAVSPMGSGLSTAGSVLSPVSSGLSPLEAPPCTPLPSNILPPEEPVLPSSGNPLFEFDVSQYLVMKKPEEEGPDIRGGHPDALVVLATKASKNDFLYQEAFLTTYRTFLSPLELIEKLCLRHQRFSSSSDLARQRASREAFSLLVRVVSDLTMSDLEQSVIQMLMDFVYQLLYKGDLTMAKALRVKILEKYAARQQSIMTNSPLSSSHSITTRQSTLLDFKSDQVAEQMTLLDSELFMKIEIPEVLIWAQEQNEERSANLTCFTEHFNKMSYWARSRILEKDDAKERERYVVKFIKIMKHLRKINNFNSYLALLSALDSAPIRRLEWQKHITEGLKEYCALIDSSSSFRAYRQALADTNPPCIPYIGLVLQDLTFVHIGNSDYLTEGIINFSKRWQQFNIVENMKRFKKGTYCYKKNERIIAFFNNFDNHLCEEAMWQMSEKIKPRGSKKPASSQ